jgi:Ulp1 family protease
VATKTIDQPPTFFSSSTSDTLPLQHLPSSQAPSLVSHPDQPKLKPSKPHSTYVQTVPSQNSSLASITKLVPTSMEVTSPHTILQTASLSLEMENLLPSDLWSPSPTLPYLRSSHPFDIACSLDDLSRLSQLASLPISTVISFVRSQPSENIRVQDLRCLLSPQSPINQQVINLYVTLLCHQCSLKCLDSTFYTILKENDWNHVSRWFLLPASTRQRRQTTPSLVGENAILIPCHINGCHWVAVTRREIQG